MSSINGRGRRQANELQAGLSEQVVSCLDEDETFNLYVADNINKAVGAVVVGVCGGWTCNISVLVKTQTKYEYSEPWDVVFRSGTEFNGVRPFGVGYLLTSEDNSPAEFHRFVTA
jgi:hypothetical protein